MFDVDDRKREAEYIAFRITIASIGGLIIGLVPKGLWWVIGGALIAYGLTAAIWYLVQSRNGDEPEPEESLPAPPPPFIRDTETPGRLVRSDYAGSLSTGSVVTTGRVDDGGDDIDEWAIR